MWAPASSSEDTRKTFTVEVGGSVRGSRFAYGRLSGMSLRIDRNEATLTGKLLGKALTDNHDKRAGLTDNTVIPVMPTQVQVYLADSAAGLAGASALARALRVEWAYRGRHQPAVGAERRQ